jgi:hypothetical protein
MRFLSVLMSVVLLPFVVFAQETPAAFDTGPLVTAVHAGQWPMVVALAIAILVSRARILMRSIFPAEWVPWVVLITTILGATSTGVIQAFDVNHAWWGGMISGLVSGLSVGVPTFVLYRQAHKEDPPQKGDDK